MPCPEYPRVDLISYAQNAEDIVLYRTFKSEPIGFYVDLGAGHPERGSVTKLLHDKLGWYGLDIEPLPYLSEELKAERTRSKVLNITVSNSSQGGTQKFYEFPEDWALSTLDPQIAQSHMSKGLKSKEHYLPSICINDILQDNFVKKNFELLKVDIEGKDYEVLNSLDFEKWSPKVILAETLCPIKKERRNDLIPELLLKKGYKETLFDGINSFFLHKDSIHLEKNLSLGANCLDYYINLRWWTRLPQNVRANYPHLNTKF